MKILQVHNKYQISGGEDVVFDSERNLLSTGGVEVCSSLLSNDSINGFGAKASLVAKVGYNNGSYKWIEAAINVHRPDIVHIHNFFPLLTPAVHLAASRAGVAVVQTLHNYRLLCAAATFMRDGAVCEKCLHGSNMWGLAHRCYRGSIPGSAAVAWMQTRARITGVWSEVDMFIALTEFARDKFIEGGLPADRIAVKPNFVDRPVYEEQAQREGALFVGRLSKEKGVDLLIETWSKLPELPLTIAGEGPELERLRAIATPNITFLGKVDRDRVYSLMRTSEFLVMPSLWYEGFPMTMVEAFSCGLPVICSRLGSMREIVREGVNGWHFTPGDADDLRRVVLDNYPIGFRSMMASTRQSYETLYSPAVNLAQLESIYEDALATRAARTR